MKNQIVLLMLAFLWMSCGDKNEVAKTEETNYADVKVNDQHFHFRQADVLANANNVDITFKNADYPKFGWTISLRGVDLKKIFYPYTLAAEGTRGLFGSEIIDGSPSTIAYVKWMAILGIAGKPLEASLTSFDGTTLKGKFKGVGAIAGEKSEDAVFDGGQFSATINFTKP